MPRVYLSLLTLAMTAVLAGCATPAAPTKTISSFNAEDAKRLLEKGNNTVRGSALARQQGGAVVTCAGGDVYLVPATAYATERVTALMGSPAGGYNPIFGGRKLVFENEPAEYRALLVKTVCDAQGFFRFTNVADGSFYVTTTVNWVVQSIPQGGALTQRVAVAGGETKEIVLSPR